jgi:hypothetical protein
VFPPHGVRVRAAGRDSGMLVFCSRNSVFPNLQPATFNLQPPTPAPYVRARPTAQNRDLLARVAQVLLMSLSKLLSPARDRVPSPPLVRGNISDCARSFPGAITLRASQRIETFARLFSHLCSPHVCVFGNSNARAGVNLRHYRSIERFEKSGSVIPALASSIKD